MEIGWGHIIRCLTLAQAMSRRQAQCEFICRRHSGHLAKRIEDQGFRVHLLDSKPKDLFESAMVEYEPLPAHADWVGTGWRDDADQTLAIMAGTDWDWVVVDHYGLDARWHKAIKPGTRRLLAIDDLADRVLEADWVLDQNLGRVPANYELKANSDALYLLGTRYALLRSEFAMRRPASLVRRSNPKLSNLLVTLGGTDRPNFTPRIVRVLLEHPLSALSHLTVVMGLQAPGLDEIRAIQQRYPQRLTLRCEVDDMASVMVESDLCIGAAGSTAWERCCLGVPTLQVVSADDQKTIARALADVGAAITLSADYLEESLIDTLNTLSLDNLACMSRVAQAQCDGLGAERVADKMCAEWSRK